MDKVQEGLIEFCTDVGEAMEILNVYKSGKEELAVSLLKEHLSKCDACLKMYGVVNGIQQVFDFDVDRERFKEFIEVVDSIAEFKNREEYSVFHIYSCFTSSKVKFRANYASNELIAEELGIADDFYKYLNESDSAKKEKTRKMAFGNPFSFVAAAAVIAVISFQFIYSNPNSVSNISRSNLFPKFDKQFAFTPVGEYEEPVSASSVMASFGLPIDKDLEKVYDLNYSNTNESPSFFNVSMIK